MSFAFLCERVRQSARESVRKGEFSERGLARLTGVSQPHIHNVLKGARSLSIKLADQLLQALKIEASEMVSGLPPAGRALPSIPLMRDVLGSSQDFRPHLTAGQVAVPEHLSRSANGPIAAYLGEDCMLPSSLAPGDLVAIHTESELRLTIDPRTVYVVRTSHGPRLRYMRSGGGRLYLAAEPFLTTPSAWECATSIYGRVVWVSRPLFSGEPRSYTPTVWHAGSSQLNLTAFRATPRTGDYWKACPSEVRP